MIDPFTTPGAGELPPLGTHIVHRFYPGFIDVMPNTIYLIDGVGSRGAVHVVRHVRPVVVTDFANALVRSGGAEGKVYTRLAKLIGDIADASLVLDATGIEGRSAPAIAIEHGSEGRVFHQGMFTELRTLTEFSALGDHADLAAHDELIRRFVGAYRFLHKDPRLEMPAEVPIETTPLRIGHYLYSTAERALPFDQRLAEAWSDDLQLSIAALGRGARALRDHDVSAEALHKRSYDLNGMLCNGFVLSENMTELERLADLAFNSGRRRAAIVEAVSLFEVGLLQARDRLPVGPRSRSSRHRAPEDLTLKMLVERVLPFLLRGYDGEPGPLIQRAQAMRSIRNRVVHQRHEPNLEEVNLVLSVVHSVLAIFELADPFKGVWKAKDPGAPARSGRFEP